MNKNELLVTDDIRYTGFDANKLMNMANQMEMVQVRDGLTLNFNIPNIIKDIADFVLGNKELNVREMESQMKLQAISQISNQCFQSTMHRIDSDTNIQISNIKYSSDVEMMRIGAETAKAIKQIEKEYSYKLSKLELSYILTENIIKDHNKWIDDEIKIKNDFIKNINKDIEYFSKRLRAKDRTKEDVSIYFDLLKIRILATEDDDFLKLICAIDSKNTYLEIFLSEDR